jgi:hypothetical protein
MKTGVSLIKAVRSGERGVALITTLMLLSAIAILVVAFFALARTEMTTSANYVDRYQAELAAQSAFEEAKNVLLRNTMNDEYLVTSIHYNSGDEDYYEKPIRSRYIYISQPDGSGIEHIPLFAGGVKQRTADPTKRTGSDRRPKFELDPGLEQAEGVIENMWLHAIDDDGNVMPVESRPYTGYLEPEEQDADGKRIRYTYWMEDLQGYANIEVIGAWTDHHKHNSNRYTRDSIRLGYGAYDERIRPGNTGPEGLRVSIDDSTRGRERFGYQFPKFFRGQYMVDQVAPGLSPREVHVAGWTDTNAAGEPTRPFLSLPDYESRRHLLMSNYGLAAFGRYTNNRWVVGMKPYRERPMIPRGFGYADEGTPRVNINELIANGDVDGIAAVIDRNLPEFKWRVRDEDMGPTDPGDPPPGFPEDYVKTIAANVIDYADRDSDPTFSDGVYRGVDTYPFVNEFFFKLEYLGYVTDPNSLTLRFEGTPFVEFWNPTNRKIEASGLSLNFEFIESMRFIETGVRYEFTEQANVLRDEPSMASVSLELEPNEYKVLGGPGGFGSITWEFTIPRSGGAPVQPGFTEITADRGDTRGYYELLMNGQVVDRAGVRGRAKDSGKIYHGMHFVQFKDGKNNDDQKGSQDGKILSGDYILRCSNPALHNENFVHGSNLGDVRMSYYVDRAQEQMYYTREGSPGGRNYRAARMTSTYYSGDGSSKPGRFSAELRLREWPDGGFDSAHGKVPDKNPPQDPTAVPTVPTEPGKAPWRHSNEGRLYSLSELGNIHDPVMWRPGGKGSYVNLSKQIFSEALIDNYVRNIPDSQSVYPDQMAGGGNSLRIGRKEHERFDEPLKRASQLLDLFHVGTTGTNLRFGTFSGGNFTPDTSADAYVNYDPRDHQPPPTADDALEAAQRPYSDVYPEDIHAQGQYRWIHGHLNVNTVPTRSDMETLLRGVFSASNYFDPDGDGDDIVDMDGDGNPIFEQADERDEILELQPEEIKEVARRLFNRRPYYAPSQVADTLGDLLEDWEALPEYFSDGMAEEIFARLFNTTTLSSRHFRIFVEGETLSRRGEPLAKATRVYEVFMRPERNSSGEIVNVTCEILSERDR